MSSFLLISLVVSKARPTMVLTVLLPSCTDEDPKEMKVSFGGCQITLQQRRYEENGCANQKWQYDEHLGFFFAFNSTLTDKGKRKLEMKNER